MKKLLSILLAVVLVIALAVPAMAADDTTAATKGSITVKNATKGYEYNAYKVFDATYNGTKVSYKTPSANASKLDDTLFGWSTAADKDGNISVWVLDDAADADVITWVKANYSQFGGTAIPGSFDDANSTVTFSDLDFGYYYITSGLGAAVTIDSAVPTQTVYDKNETTPVDPTKTIVSVDGAAKSDITAADAHVGSVVGFKLAGSTNNWIDKDTIRESWTITDTPTNMTIDASTVVVKFNGTALAASAYTATVADSGALTITVPMVDANKNSVYPANLGTAAGLIPIEITYSATITAEAAGAPAKNQIPGSSVEVDTYAFQVAKTDGTDPLPGAQFELWSTKGVADATAAALTFIDNGDGTYTYSAEGTVTTLDMTTNTTIVVKGLDNAWTYTLKETTVPEGYNQAADITVNGSSLTKVEEGVDTSVTSTALYKETVVNQAGAVLPSTGGIGTTIFYVVGGLLILAAGVLLVTKSRMRKEEN
jgi:LPXTG-motif cell wall-anchored protein